MVIARYISKEIINTFCAIVFILLFIAISNKFVMFLAKAASGKIPLSILFKAVGLFIPEFFVILAPVAMFVAILFTFSRLYADSEIAVLLTSGFDWSRLVRITLAMASIVAIIVAIMNFWVVPSTSARRAKILAHGQAAGVINAITPGRFQTIENNDNLVFYVEDVLPNGQLHNIFMAQQQKGEIITAEVAQIVQNSPQEFYLVLQNGHRYMGTPGSADYSVTSFSEYGRQLKYTAAAVPNNDTMRPSKSLINSRDSHDIAELQWRFALPLAVMLLSLIAIPLSRVQPRQGRYAKFLPAVLVYMIYYNLMTVVRRYIANGQFPPIPGIWLVHLVMFLAGVILLLQVTGRLTELKMKFTR